MVKKKVVWSRTAKKMLYAIFESDIRKGLDKKYSVELFESISGKIRHLLKMPESGMKTTDESIMALIVDSYIVLYQVTDIYIIIHTINRSEQ